METAFTKTLDLNNLGSKLVKKHRAQFSSLLHWVPFRGKKIHRKNI